MCRITGPCGCIIVQMMDWCLFGCFCPLVHHARYIPGYNPDCECVEFLPLFKEDPSVARVARISREHLSEEQIIMINENAVRKLRSDVMYLGFWSADLLDYICGLPDLVDKKNLVRNWAAFVFEEHYLPLKPRLTAEILMGRPGLDELRSTCEEITERVGLRDVLVEAWDAEGAKYTCKCSQAETIHESEDFGKRDGAVSRLAHR
jgi:hypothetical protein